MMLWFTIYQKLFKQSFPFLPCMETCVLPNISAVSARAWVSVQEVQQIPKWGDLGVGLKRGEQFSSKLQSLPALGHRLQKGRASVTTFNPLYSGSPSVADHSEHADFFLSCTKNL